MENVEQPPASNESRSRRARTVVAKRTVSSMAAAPGHGRASRSPSPGAASISVQQQQQQEQQPQQQQGLENVTKKEGDEEENSFDKDDEMSESLPSIDFGLRSEGDEEIVEVSQADAVQSSQKAKRGRKRLKAGEGVSLSPSRCKVKKGKRANCWRYFKEIQVPSDKEAGVMITKAKCKFCYTSYVYHKGGPTTRLNRHLEKCTQFQNKLAKAKLAQVNVKIALKDARQSGDPYLMGMAAAMMDKFDKYWELRNNVMVISTILDPRFKMRYITWCFGEIYDPLRCAKEVDDITKELEELYKKYNKLVEVASGNSNTQSTSCSKATSSSLASVVPSGFQSFLASSATEVSKSELLIYLEEPNVSIDDKKFDLLTYWKAHAHKFPVVSAMAKSFLAVPASSVSSESTFSTEGRVLDDYRSSLKPATVQALVCASSWIRASQSDNSAPILVEQDEDDNVESVEFPTCVVASN